MDIELCGESIQQNIITFKILLKKTVTYVIENCLYVVDARHLMVGTDDRKL